MNSFKLTSSLLNSSISIFCWMVVEVTVVSIVGVSLWGLFESFRKLKAKKLKPSKLISKIEDFIVWFI